MPGAPKIEARSEAHISAPAPSRVRAWEVVHACTDPGSVVNLMDAERAVGMHAYAVTDSGILLPGGRPNKPASLIDSWNDVRKWRRQLELCEAQIVHAHCFPAAMASVRSGRATVFDVNAFVEDLAITAGQSSDRSWLVRSFRTAEQFVLARAGAVVVHSLAMQNACKQRGVVADDLFVIPEPLFAESVQPNFGSRWLEQAFGFNADVVSVFADLSPLASAAETIQMRATLLQAFAQVRSEVENARLFVIAGNDESSEDDIRSIANGCEIADSVFVLAASDGDRALQSALIVVSGAENPAASPHDKVSPLEPNRRAYQTMLHSRTLLAADSPSNRDVSRDGRGCLWYQYGDARDLAHRLAFLARNEDFCRAMAASGHKHLLASRDPEFIAQQYDQVYRHATSHSGRDYQQPGSAVSVLVPKPVSS